MGSLAQQCRHEARRSHSLGGNPNIGWNFLSGHFESQNPPVGPNFRRTLWQHRGSL